MNRSITHALQANSWILVAAVSIASPARAEVVFTDWTFFDAAHGEGALGPVAVTFVGDLGTTLGDGHFPPLYLSCVSDESSPLFGVDYFLPPLTASDFAAVGGDESSPSYVLTFSKPVKDPVLHLASIASTLTFGGGVRPIKLSGQDTLAVEGNQVIGFNLGPPPEPNNDANGTIMLPGLFQSISFTAYWAIPPGQVPYYYDSLAIQVGGTPILCLADVTQDGVVDVDDLFTVINHWGACPESPETCPADIAPLGDNGGSDGEVGSDDLFTVINAWGPCP